MYEGVGAYVPLTSSTLISTALVVCAGKGIRDEPVFTPKIVTAGVVILFGLMAVGAWFPQLSAIFSLLLFIVAFLTYGTDILEYIGVQVES